MSRQCYINGEILEASEGVIGVSDLALQRGYGVFDFARTHNNKLFHFDDHMQRLRRSASELHLKLPIPDVEITSVAEALIRESNLINPAVRLILTGGYSNSASALHPNFVIIAEELPTYPASVYSEGVKLILVEYQRELPHVKSLNYLNAIRLEPFKHEQNAFDILYHSEYGLTECPRSNFFAFLNGALVTAPSQVLFGITREIILKLAADHFPVEARKIDLEEVSAIDEAFITSTSKCVLPVTRIDDVEVGTGAVGDGTRTMMRLFEEYTASY